MRLRNGSNELSAMIAMNQGSAMSQGNLESQESAKSQGNLESQESVMSKETLEIVESLDIPEITEILVTTETAEIVVTTSIKTGGIEVPTISSRETDGSEILSPTICRGGDIRE